MSSDADGKEKLKRVRKLLGNAEINKSDSERETVDPALPVPVHEEVQSQAADLPQPSRQPPSMPPLPVGPVKPDPVPTVSSLAVPSSPVSEQAPTEASSSRVTREGATLKELGPQSRSQKKGVETPTAVVGQLDHSSVGDSTGQLGLQPRVTVPTDVAPVVTELKNHPLHPEKDELIESLPKTAWGVKVTMKDFIFIRDHDKFRLLFKDQRTFREKFVEWMRNLETSVAPELVTARDVTLNARKATSGSAPGNPDGNSGDHL